MLRGLTLSIEEKAEIGVLLCMKKSFKKIARKLNYSKNKDVYDI